MLKTRIDRQLRHTLPRRAYEVVVGGYNGLRCAVGRSPRRGLPPHTYSDLKPLHTPSYDGISSEARARLSDYFRPYDERLNELLGAEIGWQ